MSIYSKVRDLFINDSALQVLLNATSTNKKVFFHYPKGSTIEQNIPCITYYFMETPQYRKNDYTSKDGTLFVDIWTKDNLNEIYERAITLLRGSSFFSDLVQSIDLFEDSTQIYHKHLIVSVLGG